MHWVYCMAVPGISCTTIQLFAYIPSMVVFVLYDVCCLLWVLLCVAMSYDAIINGWDMIHDFIFCLSWWGAECDCALLDLHLQRRQRQRGGKLRNPVSRFPFVFSRLAWMHTLWR